MITSIDPAHFKDLSASPGEYAVTLALAGITVRFHGLHEELSEALRRRYAPFLADARPDHAASLHEGEPAYLPPAADRFLRLEEVVHPEGNTLVSTDFAAFHPVDSEEGVLRVSEPMNVKVTVRALENYLRWTIADLIIRRGGFVLHSSGLVRDERAYVFFGHSGAGKSTVAELSGDLPILSDDLVLLLREDGVYKACTTPFWGSFAQEAKELAAYPIAGLFHLIQASEVRIEPIPPGLAAGMVLSCCPFVSDPTRRSDLLMPIIEDFVRNLPTYELHFRRDPSFWDAILASR